MRISLMILVPYLLGFSQCSKDQMQNVVCDLQRKGTVRCHNEGDISFQTICIYELAMADIESAAADHGMSPAFSFSAFWNFEIAD